MRVAPIELLWGERLATRVTYEPSTCLRENHYKNLLGCEYSMNGNDNYPRGLRTAGGRKGKADQIHGSAEKQDHIITYTIHWILEAQLSVTLS